MSPSTHGADQDLAQIETTAGTGGAYECDSLWYMSTDCRHVQHRGTIPRVSTNKTAGAISLWNVKQAAPDAFNQAS